MKVYLAGTIDNECMIECLGWRVMMTDSLAPYNIRCIDPTQTILPLPESKSNRQSFSVPARAIVERDLMDLRSCDVMVVCFPKKTKKFSIGSVMEMVYAKQAGLPVILIDQTLDFRYANHPWIKEHTTIRYDTPEQAVQNILDYWRIK